MSEHGRTIPPPLPPESVASVPAHIRDIEARGLLKRGRQPLPADFWDLPRPADPQAAVRTAVSRDREET